MTHPMVTAIRELVPVNGMVTINARAALDIATVLDRALAIEQEARKNNLLNPDGSFREVLGTLPMTADGAIVGFPPGFGGVFRSVYEQGHPHPHPIEQCNPMFMKYDPESRNVMVYGGNWSGINEHPVGGCYSTREAALAAAKGTT